MISESSSRSQTILAIIQANLSEICRQPSFIFSVTFFSLWIFLSKDLVFFAFGEEMVMIYEMGLSSMTICGLWVLFFSSVQLVTKDIEDKTIYTLLTKPLSSMTFLISKFLSIFLTTSLALGILGSVLTMVIWAREGFVQVILFQGMFLIFVEMLLLSSFALLLSLFLSPLLNFIFSFLFFTVGHLHGYFHSYLNKTILCSSGLGKDVTEILFTLIPNLEFLNLSSMIVLKKNIPFSYLLVALLYGIVYTYVLLLLSFLKFEQQEIR